MSRWRRARCPSSGRPINIAPRVVSLNVVGGTATAETSINYRVTLSERRCTGVTVNQLPGGQQHDVRAGSERTAGGVDQPGDGEWDDVDRSGWTCRREGARSTLNMVNSTGARGRRQLCGGQSGLHQGRHCA
jgi:hypothetical protein